MTLDDDQVPSATMEEEKEQDITPLKLGVRCQPPALTLLYKEGKSKRIRVMPVRFISKHGTLDCIIQELKIHHEDFLYKVPDIRIEKMLRILQETLKGSSIAEASTLVGKEYTVDPEQDLNKLTDEELSKKKKLMDNTFYKNQLKDGDEGYRYDIQVDFSTENKIDAGWDSEVEDNFWS